MSIQLQCMQDEHLNKQVKRCLIQKALWLYHVAAQIWPALVHTSLAAVFSRSRGPFSSSFSLKSNHEPMCKLVYNETSNTSRMMNKAGTQFNLNFEQTGYD